MSELDIEIIGRPADDDAVPAAELKRLCASALAQAGIRDGHVAIEFVDEARSRELNRAYRGRDKATDVLSFGVDERRTGGRPAGTRRHRGLPELGPRTSARRSCTAPCTWPGWTTSATAVRCSPSRSN